MLLKYNVNNIKCEKRLITYSSCDIEKNDKYYYLTFNVVNNHNMHINDNIILVNNNYVSEKLNISSKNFTNTNFLVTLPKYYSLNVDNTFDDTGIIGNYAMFHIKNDIRYSSILNGNEYKCYKKIHEYTYYCDLESFNGKSFNVGFDASNYRTYLGYEYVTNGVNVYKWDEKNIEIKCQYIGDNYFKYEKNNVININDTLEIEDSRFIDNDNLIGSVNVYEYNESLNISLPLCSDFNNNLNDEHLYSLYFNERKKSLIPDIIDYEKKCFTPFYLNDKTDKYEFVKKINFNLFLRDRTNSESWSTNDCMGWNQYKIVNENNSLSFKNNDYITKGDVLSYLNFTDEDVYYRKKKISKSFIRLSFYNSPDTINQMLLFYSTIFLDSGELYTKYVNNLIKYGHQNETDYKMVSDETIGDDALTLSFNVCDKYNVKKSSEGFYLFLFPDALKKMESVKLYMKVEFNHAGYGKTLPLIYPVIKNGDRKYILDFKNDNFPTSLINSENTDLKKLYEFTYIPLTITYDSKNGYIYYFDAVEFESNEITINLYEPKLNDFK
jgi:hypothetical protein